VKTLARLAAILGISTTLGLGLPFAAASARADEPVPAGLFSENPAGPLFDCSKAALDDACFYSTDFLTGDVYFGGVPATFQWGVEVSVVAFANDGNKRAGSVRNDSPGSFWFYKSSDGESACVSSGNAADLNHTWTNWEPVNDAGNCNQGNNPFV
jgi:hypothetical protein